MNLLSQIKNLPHFTTMALAGLAIAEMVFAASPSTGIIGSDQTRSSSPTPKLLYRVTATVKKPLQGIQPLAGAPVNYTGSTSSTTSPIDPPTSSSSSSTGTTICELPPVVVAANGWQTCSEVCQGSGFRCKGVGLGGVQGAYSVSNRLNCSCSTSGIRCTGGTSTVNLSNPALDCSFMNSQSSGCNPAHITDTVSACICDPCAGNPPPSTSSSSSSSSTTSSDEEPPIEEEGSPGPGSGVCVETGAVNNGHSCADSNQPGLRLSEVRYLVSFSHVTAGCTDTQNQPPPWGEGNQTSSSVPYGNPPKDFWGWCTSAVSGGCTQTQVNDMEGCLIGRWDFSISTCKWCGCVADGGPTPDGRRGSCCTNQWRQNGACGCVPNGEVPPNDGGVQNCCSGWRVSGVCRVRGTR